MTTAEAHALATTSPVRTLTTRIGELKEDADRQVANLTATLKQIDHTRELLDQHGLPFSVDLGAVGNACANARRAQLDDADKHTFALPKAAA